MSIGDLFLISTLLGLSFYLVGTNDENSAEAYPSYEYKQIFQGVPTFFEYLLNAVEENPEILENNDAKVTEKNIKEDISNDNSPYTPNDEENCNETENNGGGNGIDFENNDDSDKRKDTSTVAYEYGNGFVIIGTKDEVCDSKTKREVNRDENIVVAEDLAIKEVENNRVVKDKEASPKDLNDDDKDDDWEKGFVHPGFRNLFSLDITAEEIEQGIIRTEQLLEEYNYNRLNKRKP